MPRVYHMFSETTDPRCQMPWSKDRASVGKNLSSLSIQSQSSHFFEYKKKKMHEGTEERFEDYESLNYNS